MFEYRLRLCVPRNFKNNNHNNNNNNNNKWPALPLSFHKSDQYQISPAASPEILHPTVWITWLFITQFSIYHIIHFHLKSWKNVLCEATILDKSVGTPALFRWKSPPLRFPPPPSPSQCCISGLKVHFFGATLTRGEGDVTLRKRDPPERRKQSD